MCHDDTRGADRQGTAQAASRCFHFPCVPIFFLTIMVYLTKMNSLIPPARGNSYTANIWVDIRTIGGELNGGALA